jgi:hypothetical protein
MPDLPPWVRGPGNTYVPPNARLYGSYACSYSGFQHAFPPFKNQPGQQPIPQIGGYVEVSPPSVTPLKAGQYDQVEGYVPMAFTGVYTFFGNGQLSGHGRVSQGQNSRSVEFTGTYDVTHDPAPSVYSGTLETIDVNSGVKIDHYFVVADDWRELRFIITGTGKRQMAVNGSMIRVTSV